MKTVDEKRRIELDKAIAYFMGWRIDNTFPDKGKVWRKGNAIELESTFKFSSDWNALMEVFKAVNKIKTCIADIDSVYCEVRMYNTTGLDWEAENSFEPGELQENVYISLGEFVEFYNKREIKLNVES